MTSKGYVMYDCPLVIIQSSVTVQCALCYSCHARGSCALAIDRLQWFDGVRQWCRRRRRKVRPNLPPPDIAPWDKTLYPKERGSVIGGFYHRGDCVRGGYVRTPGWRSECPDITPDTIPLTYRQHVSQIDYSYHVPKGRGVTPIPRR